MTDWSQVIQWLGAVALALLTWAFKQISNLGVRVSVLESQHTDNREWMARLDGKLDKIDDKLDKLYDRTSGN